MARRKGPIANRIVGHGEESPEQLLANPLNARIHPKFQQDALEGTLDEVGWVQTVIVNQATGYVLDGHLRIAVAITRGEPMIPVSYVNLTADEERLMLAVLDPIGALAGKDAQIMAELTAGLEVESAALQELLAQLNDIEQVPGKGLTDPDDVPDVPTGTPRVAPGDIWICGNHRVACGDATVSTDWDRLMDGAKANMVWTDPPYGVSYDGGSKKRKVISNDDLNEGGLEQLLRDAFVLAVSHCRTGAPWYVAAPPGPLHNTFGIVLHDLNIHHQTLIWVKDNSTLGPMGQDYHWRHEPIFYGWTPGAAHSWHGDRKQDTIWEIARPKKSDEHPTMKPVDLVSRSLQNSSQRGDLVVDPFGGSGTTLIASEGGGRTCYTMELDPGYATVIVDRWEAHTGRTAELDRRDIADR